ncbi:uncharacterized protein LOC133175001 [Saccostrea echinata]|uniref:uncharacterized protein LOC133175001 n=1 Tax=Saccostrea echinata TaxID=191078 RepID=UPI002A826D50|nr:uncharacterized protein LOC133175001 [Saccostrea echinata]
MAEIRVKFNVAMVLAVVAAEILSLVMYTHYSSWHHSLGHRNLIAAIIADCVLVYILKLIKENFWDPKDWEDAAILSMWLALLYLGFQMPHVVHNTYSFTHFFFHVVHKFAISFVMLFIMERFKRY